MRRPKLDWDGWMAEVDRYLEERHGLHSLDIDDWRYADDYLEGISPMQSARRALKNSMEATGWRT